MGTAASKGDGRRLRSVDWFGEPGRMGAIYRSWVRGYPPEVFDGRPVIGIANSWSELTPCNAHLRRVADAVKRGVWQAGGFPLEFPTTSIGETLMRPTAMLFRNLMSMDVEETLRANPVDGVVLLSGCDKTTPGRAHGRRQRRPARDHGHRRPDALGQVPGPRRRLRHRHLAVQRGGAGGPHVG